MLMQSLMGVSQNNIVQSLMSVSQNNIDSRLCAQVRKHTAGP